MDDGPKNYTRAREISGSASGPPGDSSPAGSALDNTTPASKRNLLSDTSANAPTLDATSKPRVSPDVAPKPLPPDVAQGASTLDAATGGSASRLPDKARVVDGIKRYAPKPGGESAAPSAANSKGQIVNAGVQALGAAAGNVAGGSAAAAAGAAGTAGSTAATAADSTATAAKNAADVGASGAKSAVAPKDAAEIGRDMAKRKVKDGAKNVGERAAKEKSGDKHGGGSQEKVSGGSWGDLAKDAEGAIKDGAQSKPSSVFGDDDRGRATKMRDNLKERTGVDADAAAGAVAGGAAAAATLATGVGAPLAGAAGAAGNAVGTGVSKVAHTVHTKFSGIRKTATLSIASAAVLAFMSLSSVLGMAGEQSQNNDEQAAAVMAQASQQRDQSDAAEIACPVPQEAPVGYLYNTTRQSAVLAIQEVADTKKVPAYGVVIAVAVGLAESRLDEDMDGDGGASGVFGFIPGAGTGTAEQLIDPAFSAALFFDRLFTIEAWQGQPLDQTASTVMKSAFPNQYGQYESAARAAMAQSGNATVGAGCEPLGTPIVCDPVPLIETINPVLTPDARSLLRCAMALQKVNQIESRNEGSTLAMTVPDTAAPAAALDEPGGPTEQAESLTAAGLLSWLSATYETFGVKSVTHAGQKATFRSRAVIEKEQAEGVEDVPRYDLVDVPTTGPEYDPYAVVVEVWGTAGTGVVSAISGSWVLPAIARCISSEFGMRVNPVTGVYKLHGGTDFPLPLGTPVYAAAGGTVTATIAARLSAGGGNMVVIDHGAGVTTEYLHNSKIAAKIGQVVLPGTIVAYAGSTGNSTGSHLHFNVKRAGSPTNPRPYFESVGVAVPRPC